MHYVDTSVLIAYLTPEVFSEQADRALRASAYQPLSLSDWTETELVSAHRDLLGAGWGTGSSLRSPMGLLPAARASKHCSRASAFAMRAQLARPVVALASSARAGMTTDKRLSSDDAKSVLLGLIALLICASARSAATALVARGELSLGRTVLDSRLCGVVGSGW